jgi:colanic acid/amylovoran biosynthesis glycosyltransferase
MTAISLAKRNGADVDATWFGSGPLLEKAKAVLRNEISFASPLSHGETLERLKTFDAFVFCHKTSESPRCLIEAPACGLPILGYRSAYASDLIKQNKGGVLLEKGSVIQLAESITTLAKDRALLADLSQRALADGASFSDDAVSSIDPSSYNSLPDADLAHALTTGCARQRR